jgi:thiol:disulfide interchange protein
MSEPLPPAESELNAPKLPYPAEWSVWTKRVAAILLLIAALYSVTFLGPVLQVLIIALLLVLFFFIPIQFMMRWLRFPYWLAVISVFVLYLRQHHIGCAAHWTCHRRYDQLLAACHREHRQHRHHLLSAVHA